MSVTVHSGGCQCGAVRFAATGAPVRASICHCRMCQRASGGVFAPLVEFLNADLEWIGTPATFRSSDIAERGFCSRCGTPLFLRDFGSESTDMMIGAFDAPDLLPPEYNYGIESRIGWVDGIAALPGYETGGGPHGDNPVLPISLQAPQEGGR